MVGPIRPDPFREPGRYKVEATYKVPPGFKNVDPRLEFDEWPFWGGELKSNAVTIEVKPAVGVERQTDFQKNAASLHLAVSIQTPDRFPLPPAVQLRYVYLDARPIPREPRRG